MARLSWIVAALFCAVFAAAAVQARPVKEVYLRDGGIIDAQKAWIAGETVKVLVNRDTLLNFSTNEVDMRKTFPKKPATRVKKSAVKKKIRHRKQVAATHGATVHRTDVKTSPDVTAKPELKQGPAANTANPNVLPRPKPASPVKPAAPVKTPAKAAPVAPVAGTAGPATSGKAFSVPKIPGSAGAKPAIPHSPVVKPNLRPKPVNVGNPVPSAIMASALTQDQVMNNLLYALVLTVIMMIAMCRIFAKAGRAWWKALVPIYSLFVFVSIAGKPWWWVLLLMIPLVNFIIFLLLNVSLAKKFGQGAGYGIGLALLGFIFFPLLAFGKAEYRI